MQPDVSTSSTTGGGATEPTAAGGQGAVTYLSEAVGGIGRTIGYYFQQPMVIASLVVAIIGGAVGVRVAQIQAEQRRRAFYQRWMEGLGRLVIIALAVMRIRRRRMLWQELMQERGKEVAETTRGWGDFLARNVPMVGRAPVRGGGIRSTAQQVGYALSLLPVTIALLRSPMVRNVGLRMMSRGMAGRPGRSMAWGITRGLIRR
jgi:hypothetical protein